MVALLMKKIDSTWWTNQFLCKNLSSDHKFTGLTVTFTLKVENATKLPRFTVSCLFIVMKTWLTGKHTAISFPPTRWANPTLSEFFRYLQTSGVKPFIAHVAAHHQGAVVTSTADAIYWPCCLCFRLCFWKTWWQSVSLLIHPSSMITQLTHWELVTPYGDINLGQHSLR